MSEKIVLSIDHYALYSCRSSMNVNSLLIRHARILWADGQWLLGDLLVRDERIVEIATSITNSNATGLVLLPALSSRQ